MPAGAIFLIVEGIGGPLSYEIDTTIRQTSLVITSVTPTTGGPGTPVVVSGNGFSTDPDENLVGIMAEIPL